MFVAAADRLQRLECVSTVKATQRPIPQGAWTTGDEACGKRFSGLDGEVELWSWCTRHIQACGRTGAALFQPHFLHILVFWHHPLELPAHAWRSKYEDDMCRIPTYEQFTL